METIVSVVKGESLNPDSTNNCIFCGKLEKCTIFSIITCKKADGLLLKSFYLCSEHLEKLNTILSGEFDIDTIFLEKFAKTSTTLKLRG